MAEPHYPLPLAQQDDPDGVVHHDADAKDTPTDDIAEDEICPVPCPCIHHPPSEKYPASLRPPHIQSLDSFAESITKSLKPLFPRKERPYPYTAVYVLLINFEADDISTSTEIRDLEKIFRETFNYSTKFFNIPSHMSRQKLEREIIDFRYSHDEPTDLKIIYYGGHGDVNRRGECIWVANQMANSPRVNWSALQSLLERAEGDVLFILDCCYAASSVRGQSTRSKAVLAACGRDEVTRVGNNSFTRTLIGEFNRLGNQHMLPISVDALHAELMRLKGKKKLPTTPVYASLCGSTISLAALPVDSSAVTPSSSSDTSTEPSSNSSEVENETMSESSMSSSDSLESRVLVRIFLEHSGELPILDQWHMWFKTNRPSNIKELEFVMEHVRLESVFTSTSNLLLVSMPVLLWNTLPENPAYSFVAFIYSKNLLDPRNADETRLEMSLKDQISIQALSPAVKDKMDESISKKGPCLEPNDIDSGSDISSMSESGFSNISYSTDLTDIEPEARDRLVDLFLSDEEFRPLLVSGLEAFGSDKFRRKFSHLLIRYFKDLRSIANNPREKKAAWMVQRHRAYLSMSLSERLDVGSSQVELVVGQSSEDTGLAEAEMEAEGDESSNESDTEVNLTSLESFMISGTAFALLKTRLATLISADSGSPQIVETPTPTINDGTTSGEEGQKETAESIKKLEANKDEEEERPKGKLLGSEVVLAIHSMNGMMRAGCLLDTGSDVNLMSPETASRTGFEIEPYRGPTIQTGFGNTVTPLGEITLRWRIIPSAKSYTSTFVVIKGFSGAGVTLGHQSIMDTCMA